MIRNLIERFLFVPRPSAPPPLFRMNASDATVRFGTWNSAGLGAIDLPAGRIVMHSDYDRSADNNDIAMIQLKTAVAFDANIQAICLPKDPTTTATAPKKLLDDAGHSIDPFLFTFLSLFHSIILS